MKQKSKMIAASVATIAMSSVLAVGGTFALFTSESKVNIAVSAGSVEIVATAMGFETWSGNWVESEQRYVVTPTVDIAATEYSEAGRAMYFINDVDTAKSVEESENVVTITQMAPYDMVTFYIKIVNNSDIAIQYQTILSRVSENEIDLFDALEIRIGKATTDFRDIENYTLDGYMSDRLFLGGDTPSFWEYLEPGSGDIYVPVSVYFPCTDDRIVGDNADNYYQGAETEIAYTVTAVQANANTGKPIKETMDYDTITPDVLDTYYGHIKIDDGDSVDNVISVVNKVVDVDTLVNIDALENGTLFGGVILDGVSGYIQDAVVKTGIDNGGTIIMSNCNFVFEGENTLLVSCDTYCAVLIIEAGTVFVNGVEIDENTVKDYLAEGYSDSNIYWLSD